VGTSVGPAGFVGGWTAGGREGLCVSGGGAVGGGAAGVEGFGAPGFGNGWGVWARTAHTQIAVSINEYYRRLA